MRMSIYLYLIVMIYEKIKCSYRNLSLPYTMYNQTSPSTNKQIKQLLRQQIELIATEGVKLHFEDDAVREIARMAALLNRTVENIGARRLHTVIERIMEILSFEAAEMEDGSVITIDKALIEERLSDVLVESDLSRYIL